jgi:electron transfer flavoprotein alpha subunit
VTAARKIAGAGIHIVVLAVDPASVAAQAAKIEGVNEVLTIANAANANALASIIAPQIVALAADYSHVFGPSTTFGKDLMPRIAALLGVSQISDAMSVIDANTFTRPIYAGNAIVTVKSPADQKIVATIRNASFPATPNGSATAPITAKTVAANLPSHTRFVGLHSGGGDRPDLQTARIVISGGRALGSAENFKLIYDLADKLKAGVGASRAAVDAGYAPNDMQVGQTGKIISPELYIAIGISGAIQHLTGIKDAGTIVAINKDGEAPIFELADFGLVGDLFKLLPEFQAALS